MHRFVLFALLPLLALAAGASNLCSQSPTADVHSRSPSDRTSSIAIGGVEPISRDLQHRSAFQRVTSADPDSDLPVWHVDGWELYDRLWRELAVNPKNETLRRYLGFPIANASDQSSTVRISRGRSAPEWLGWSAGSYQQIDTSHFRVFCRADPAAGRLVAEDLERVYWIWTQVFFPFWDGRPQFVLHTKSFHTGTSLASQLGERRSRLASRKKMRVVLFRDAEEYRQTLGKFMPGVERSTGFYSDDRLTSFFYPSQTTDATASRRHELVHQLFREASTTKLPGQTAGRDKAFWLVEGIAGYFESLQVGNPIATVGGWDSPRLQFARFRILTGGDFFPISELDSEGQQGVQTRQDIARWYAHAIAHVHRLMDGGSVAERRWLYQRLADVYKIELAVDGAAAPQDSASDMVDFLKVSDQLLQSNPTHRPLAELCLAGCEVTALGLDSIKTAQRVHWLDLSRLPIDSGAVKQLCPDPNQLTQLSLEATRIDDSIASWISRAGSLRELDVSWTTCGDSLLETRTQFNELETLWLTGTRVSDASVETISTFPKLESIDLQRSAVSNSAIARLKMQKPHWNINPLQLIEQRPNR